MFKFLDVILQLQLSQYPIDGMLETSINIYELLGNNIKFRCFEEDS